jgi:hypothetical protein
MSEICLNCGQATSGKYCSSCGQKTDTHRITLKHFIAHDLMHGFWHLDRGILFTVKEAVVRPGQAALDYISGKRIRYYNVFYLSLLLIALNVILWHLADIILGEDKSPDNDTELAQLLSQYVKVMVLSLVPLFALNGRVFFSKLKLNLPEHFILGGITLVGILLVTLPFPLLYVLERTTSEYFAIGKIVLLIPLVFYPVWTYRNASKGKYSFLGFFWRATLFLMLLIWEMLFLLGLLGYLFTKESTFSITL